MQKILFYVFSLFVSITAFAQNDFPESWVGNYEGELEIYGKNDVRMLVNMKLEIQPKTDSLFTWHLIYEMDGKADKRMYELKVLDRDNGHYLIDEKNTILIDGFYHLDRFTSLFEVLGAYILTSYTQEENNLIFEIVAGSMMNPRITGNQEHEGNKIPEVKTYSVSGRQKAVLKKVG